MTETEIIEHLNRVAKVPPPTFNDLLEELGESPL